MKRNRCLLLAAFLCTIIAGCSNLQRNEDVLIQTSTIDALLVGVYDGNTTFKELKGHEDFGLGTFNGLDGEMHALDGLFYQIKSHGVAYPVVNVMITLFSVVAFFDSHQIVEVGETVDYEGLSRHLDRAIKRQFPVVDPLQRADRRMQHKGDLQHLPTESPS